MQDGHEEVVHLLHVDLEHRDLDLVLELRGALGLLNVEERVQRPRHARWLPPSLA